MTRAIVAYSFGGEPGRPGLPNQFLAQSVAEARRKGDIVLVQDYIAPIVRWDGVPPDFVVKRHRQVGQFLSTEEATLQFAEYLRFRSVSEVFLVAHPFLHRYKCRRLLEQLGFEVEVVPTDWMPFDPECSKWWVRSPLHLLAYALLQFFFGRQGR